MFHHSLLILSSCWCFQQQNEAATFKLGQGHQNLYSSLQFCEAFDVFYNQNDSLTTCHGSSSSSSSSSSSRFNIVMHLNMWHQCVEGDIN